jgi:hypothetical protein
MFAGDREIVRMTVSLLQLAINNLEGINDSANQSSVGLIEECTDRIKIVQNILHEVDRNAVTYQFSPGQESM